MENRALELGILSADNLKDVKHLSKMKTYVAAWIDPYVKYTTRSDEKGGVNPIWNEKFTFIVPEDIFQQQTTCLTVEILSRSLTGDRTVGEVTIPLPNILKLGSGRSNELHFASYQVMRPSSRVQGELHLSFRWSNKFKVESMAEKLAGAPATHTPSQGRVVANPPSPMDGYGDRKVVEEFVAPPTFPSRTPRIPTPPPPPPPAYKKPAPIVPSLPLPARPPTAPPKASHHPPRTSSPSYLPAPVPPTKLYSAPAPAPQGKIYTAPTYSPGQQASSQVYIPAPPGQYDTPKGRAGEASGGGVFKGQLGEVLLKDVIR